MLEAVTPEHLWWTGRLLWGLRVHSSPVFRHCAKERQTPLRHFGKQTWGAVCKEHKQFRRKESEPEGFGKRCNFLWNWSCTEVLSAYRKPIVGYFSNGLEFKGVRILGVALFPLHSVIGLTLSPYSQVSSPGTCSNLDWQKEQSHRDYLLNIYFQPGPLSCFVSFL